MGRSFLGIGAIVSISATLALLYTPVFFPRYQLGNEIGLYVLLAATLLGFPISIAIFPWAYATRWWIADDKIFYLVPAPKSASKSWSIKNSNFKSIKRGAFFYKVLRDDQTTFKLPRYLVATDLGLKRNIQPVLFEGKIAFQIEQ